MLGMVVHALNPSAWKAKADVSEFEIIQVGVVSSRPARVSVTLSQKPKPRKQNKTKNSKKIHQSKYFLVIKTFMRNIHFSLLNFLPPDSCRLALVVYVL